MELVLLTHVGGHDVQIFGLALPGPTLLPGLRGRRDGGDRVTDPDSGPVEEHGARAGPGRLEWPGRRVRRLDGRHRRRQGPLQRRLVLDQRRGGGRRRGRGGRELLVMVLAEHRSVAHTELVTLGQHHHAHGATEARHVEHRVPGAHHQLRRRNGRLAPAAPTYPEQTATNKCHLNIYIRIQQLLADLSRIRLSLLVLPVSNANHRRRVVHREVE